MLRTWIYALCSREFESNISYGEAYAWLSSMKTLVWLSESGMRGRVCYTITSPFTILTNYSELFVEDWLACKSIWLCLHRVNLWWIMFYVLYKLRGSDTGNLCFLVDVFVTLLLLFFCDLYGRSCDMLFS